MQEIASAPGGADAMTEFFLGLQVWGTPEQCYEKIMTTRSVSGAERFNGVFSYAGMPYDDGRAQHAPVRARRDARAAARSSRSATS